jgi:redox-sensitive bicupin YhaK (pirin superfamily)
MVVAAHPHTGLQTVTWLFEGQVEHRDSIGSAQQIEPGQVNLMTAGHGISHSEISANTDGNLHAVQLWLALPEADRDCTPFFEHRAELPVLAVGAATVTVFAGSLLGAYSPATMFTDSFGAEVILPAGSTLSLPVDIAHEVGVLVVEGEATVNGTTAALTELAFVEPGGVSVTITAVGDSRLVVLGGTPFTERLVMWWNFVARSHDEIRSMRADWESQGERFPEFTDYIGGRIPAPDLPNVTLQPRG